MGYNVRINNTSFFLPKNHYDAAYKAVCDLNYRNDLKSGGRYPRTEKNTHGPHRDICFAWMAWNYHETCKSLVSVLEELGFYVTEDDTGIIKLGYDSNMGDENWFLCVLAPYVQSGSSIHWIGEDDGGWTHLFLNGQLYTNDGRTEYQKVELPKLKVLEDMRD